MNTVSRMPKTAQMSFLVKVLMFSLISLLVIIGIIANVAKSADYMTSINTCRSSVILQDTADVDIAGVEVFRPTPKICKTHDIKIPETKGIFIYEETRDGVMKNIADRMADCWYELGEGQVDDVFGSKKPWQRDKCFSCFTFTVDDINALKEESITPHDLYEFMRTTPYKAEAESRAYCTGDQDSKTENCIKSTDPECVRKGGICSSGAPSTTQSVYENWDCDKADICLIEDNKIMTYMEYVYISGGKGAILFDPTMEKFEFDKEYAITYISDTSMNDLAVIAGVAMAVGATVGVILLAVPTGGGSVVAATGAISGGTAFVAGAEGVAITSSVIYTAEMVAVAGTTASVTTASTAGLAAGTGAAVSTGATLNLFDRFWNKDIDTILISDSVKTDNVCHEERGISG